jgi:hypothetical protein
MYQGSEVDSVQHGAQAGNGMVAFKVPTYQQLPVFQLSDWITLSPLKDSIAAVQSGEMALSKKKKEYGWYTLNHPKFIYPLVI